MDAIRPQTSQSLNCQTNVWHHWQPSRSTLDRSHTKYTQRSVIAAVHQRWTCRGLLCVTREFTFRWPSNPETDQTLLPEEELSGPLGARSPYCIPWLSPEAWCGYLGFTAPAKPSQTERPSSPAAGNTEGRACTTLAGGQVQRAGSLTWHWWCNLTRGLWTAGAKQYFEINAFAS